METCLSELVKISNSRGEDRGCFGDCYRLGQEGMKVEFKWK